MTAFRGVVLAATALCIPVTAAATGPDTKYPTVTSVAPVVIHGSQAPDLIGQNATRLSAFRCRENRIEPVLFQMDEFDENDRAVSPGAAAFKKDQTPGVLDDNDQLVLMLRDTGAQCAPELLARANGLLVEIAANAFFLNGPAYVYFLASDRGMALPQTYVKYDRETDFTDTPAFGFGYFRNQPILLDRLMFRDIEGMKNTDILDHQKARFKAKTLGNLMTISIDESDYHSNLQSVRAGPVRVIREVDAEVTPVPGLTIKAVATYYHYDRLWLGDVRFKVPKAAALFTSSMDMIATLDFSKGQNGISLYTEAVPGGVLIDGQMLDSEKSISFGRENWFLARGKGLNLTAWIDLDADFSVTPRARFIDDPNLADPPEETVGGSPEVGYEFTGWENLKAKWYRFVINMASYPAFPEGGASIAYRALHNPLQISARTVSGKVHTDGEK